MFYAFFTLAAVSPGRQRIFRQVVAAHLAFLLGCAWAVFFLPKDALIVVFAGLVIAGMVEGALLLGWRLTQLPKSQALEFLLVSPLQPHCVFLAEAFVGLTRLALVTLSGLPVLMLFILHGRLEWLDLGPLLLMPWTWGALVGLGLTTWAYEHRVVRRWAERGLLAGVLIYLTVGILAGEHLKEWIRGLPDEIGLLVLNSVEAFYRYNPFAVCRFWLIEDVGATWERMVGVEAAALTVVLLLLLRAACRLQGHFQDRHYRPAVERQRGRRGSPGEQPLTWWAIRRVTEYSGRVNLWLAGGFGVLYALYTLAGSAWPSWIGRRIFEMFDEAGGVPLWTSALVVLAAVPAAFQYGLWDSNAQERGRRLELLLLTALSGGDYWRAAAGAAWRRGRGYFAVALLLWAAAVLGGSLSVAQGIAGMAAGVLLWGLYFALGFRAFSRGMQANTLGLGLTVGLPLCALVLQKLGWSGLAALLPPASVYYAAGGASTLAWVLGSLLMGLAALVFTRRSLACCERDLRAWYNQQQGQIVLS
jgi:hypothetical protein